MTGWSYTKVNRLLTEGRRAFLRRVSGIQRGADCARYEPLLSALADGEASAEDLATLRPHMQTCLSCRAALREFRAAPERVAGVLPPAVLVASGVGGPLRSLLESMVGASERLHAAAELASGQKIAAVALSAAALAGGGTAIDNISEHKRPLGRSVVQQHAQEPAKDELPVEVAPAPPPEAEAEAQPPPAEAAPAPTPPEPAESPPPPPDPANEFAPGRSAPAAAAAPTPAPAQPGGGFATVRDAGGGSGSGASSEFAP
jgi:hypothetical protein